MRRTEAKRVLRAQESDFSQYKIGGLL